MAATSERPAASAHAIEQYLPEERSSRRGIALCLSGGGFRAALFHLGAVRRLDELGVLSRVETISSVSGGSILAAFLADRLRPWPSAGRSTPDWESRVAAPFRELTTRNLRTGPILSRLAPWNWLDSSAAVEALAEEYRRHLTPLPLAGLPERPRFVLSATDMAFGVNWTFDREEMGDYQAGWAKVPPDFPLARAVAASSCFPPVFNPLPVELPADTFRRGRARGEQRERCLADLRLSDGGVYDNMGLEPVWKSHAIVLVSDGGAPFETAPDRGLLRRLRRYISIQGNQAAALRKRWLISSFLAGELEGTYWGIATPVRRYGVEVPGYPEKLVKEAIAQVRTDLNRFSAAEAAVLENHGYLLAEAAVRRHLPDLPGAAGAAPLAPPHPDWLDAERAWEALR